jgi:hypothetical protein
MLAGCGRSRRLLLDEVVEWEELRLTRHTHLLEDRADHLSETLECLLGFPDVHDPPAVIGRAGGVRKNPTRAVKP